MLYNRTWRRNTITEVERCYTTGLGGETPKRRWRDVIQHDLEEKHHNGGGEMLYNMTWRRNTITELERCYTTGIGGETP